MAPARTLLRLAALLCTAWRAARAGGQDDCEQPRLEECTQPIALLSGNAELRFVAGKEELDRRCLEFDAGLRCIENHLRRCMTPDQRTHFNHLYYDIYEIIREICREGFYQTEYLRHAPCMNQVEPENDKCTKAYQEKIHSLEQQQQMNLTNSENEKQLRKLCCSFQEFLQCSQAVVQLTCGDEAANFTSHFLDKMSASLIQVHCERYVPGSQKCAGDSAMASRSSVAVFLLLVLTARNEQRT
ncbi:uncharacterized protein LOC134527574 [Bacillus rossius redtenbacheri]|uniref:uncharacterized protein LOC134527574 n=1 Tax=Bacillus rossius redtenbacheri TaxID=93214 RepID=UPI002FDE1F73